MLVEAGSDPRSVFDIEKRAACLARPEYDRNRQIVFAVAAIGNQLSERKTLHCLVHEIYHGLGFGGHSSIVRSSVLNVGEDDTDIPLLSLSDKVLLRTLYDPRTNPGMPREDAIKMVRQIIPELVESVRSHGFKALYQR